MSRVTIGTLNQIILIALKEVIKSNPHYNTREYCLFALADDGRGKLIGTVIDRKTSIMFKFLIAKDYLDYYSKAVFIGIFKQLLEKNIRIANKSPIDRYNWKKNPLKARGRTAQYTALIAEDKFKIYLFSWGKVIL